MVDVELLTVEVEAPDEDVDPDSLAEDVMYDVETEVVKVDDVAEVAEVLETDTSDVVALVVDVESDVVVVSLAWRISP